MRRSCFFFFFCGDFVFCLVLKGFLFGFCWMSSEMELIETFRKLVRAFIGVLRLPFWHFSKVRGWGILVETRDDTEQLLGPFSTSRLVWYIRLMTGLSQGIG